MCWGSRIVAIAVLGLSSGPAARAASEGFIVGLGAEADTEDGRAFSVLADLALRDHTWLGAALAHSRNEAIEGTHGTWYADVELDHRFESFGFRLGAGYWGDSDVLDSVDVRASLYLQGTSWSLAADYERRNFDFVFGRAALPVPRTVEFSADGAGLNTRLRPAERFSLYAGGMWYDYSRNERLQQDIDSLRFLSVSRLVLMNSLIDYRWHAGFETSFGLRLVDLRFSRWRTAVDQGRVDSFGVGFLTPLGLSSDIELRLAFDNSETFGAATVFSVFLYFFGDS